MRVLLISIPTLNFNLTFLSITLRLVAYLNDSMSNQSVEYPLNKVLKL